MPGATSITRIGSPASSSRSTRHQGVRGELGRVVPAAALVGDVPGDRGDGQDVGVARRRRPIGRRRPQQRQQRAGHPLDREHVDVEHARPVLGVAVLDAMATPKAPPALLTSACTGPSRREVVAQAHPPGPGRSGRRRTRRRRSRRRAAAAGPRGGRPRRHPSRAPGTAAPSPPRSPNSPPSPPHVSRSSASSIASLQLSRPYARYGAGVTDRGPVRRSSQEARSVLGQRPLRCACARGDRPRHPAA